MSYDVLKADDLISVMSDDLSLPPIPTIKAVTRNGKTLYKYEYTPVTPFLYNGGITMAKKKEKTIPPLALEPFPIKDTVFSGLKQALEFAVANGFDEKLLHEAKEELYLFNRVLTEIKRASEYGWYAAPGSGVSTRSWTTIFKLARNIYRAKKRTAN